MSSTARRPVLDRLPADAHHQPIGAEGFLVEEVRALQSLEHGAIGGRGWPPPRARPDRCRCADIKPSASLLNGNGDRNARRPAVGNPQLAARPELVALRVPAEIVVVVEDQDARVLVDARAIEVRGRETADPAADDDEVVGFARLDRLACPERSRRAGTSPEARIAQRRATRRTIRRGCRACRSAPADSSPAASCAN